MSKIHFTGIMPAIITPLDADGNVNFQAVKASLELMGFAAGNVLWPAQPHTGDALKRFNLDMGNAGFSFEQRGC